MKKRNEIIIISLWLISIPLLIFPLVVDFIIIPLKEDTMDNECSYQIDGGETKPCKREYQWPLNIIEREWIRYNEQSNWDKIFN